MNTQTTGKPRIKISVWNAVDHCRCFSCKHDFERRAAKSKTHKCPKCKEAAPVLMFSANYSIP